MTPLPSNRMARARASFAAGRDAPRAAADRRKPPRRCPPMRPLGCHSACGDETAGGYSIAGRSASPQHWHRCANAADRVPLCPWRRDGSRSTQSPAAAHHCSVGIGARMRPIGCHSARADETGRGTAQSPGRCASPQHRHRCANAAHRLPLSPWRRDGSRCCSTAGRSASPQRRHRCANAAIGYLRPVAMRRLAVLLNANRSPSPQRRHRCANAADRVPLCPWR